MVGALLDVLVNKLKDQYYRWRRGDETGSILWNWRQDVCPGV